MRKCMCRHNLDEETDAPEAQNLNVIMQCDYSEIDRYLTTKGTKANITEERTMDPLLFAAATGYSDLVTLLLKRNKDINTQDLLDRTALHLAVACGNKKIARMLMEHGAEVHSEDFHGYTPLCEAVWRMSAEMTEMLTTTGAKPSDEHCLLHYSVLRKDLVITKLLLDAGADPNLRDSNGDTPLLIAARTHDIQMAEMLTTAGAKPNDEHCLLHYSVSRKDLAIAKLLLVAGADPNMRDSNGNTPLLIAARTHDIQVAEILLENGAIPHASNHLTGLTPLHVLITSNYDEEDYDTTFEAFASLLIKHEVDLDMGGPLNGTALTKCLFNFQYKAAQYLIQMGADVNKLPQVLLNPITNLRLALARKRYDLVRLMVAAGYDLAKGSPELRLENKKETDPDSPQGWLLEKKFGPRSLADIIRLQIRKEHSSRISSAVPKMNLPKPLQRFLMLEGIADEQNGDISFLS